MRLRRLSIQDAIWVNYLLVGYIVPFDYAHLEQAVNCQYTLGKNESSLLFELASRLYNSFCQHQPFTKDNSRTGFIMMTAFLTLNGWAVSDSATYSHLLEEKCPKLEESSVRALVVPYEDHHHETVQSAVREVLPLAKPRKANSA